MLCAVLLLTACQTGSSGISNHVNDLLLNDFLQKGGDALNLTNNLMVIQYDFKHGRIMRARKRALAMESSHRDYASTQTFLNHTIEPARQRIFLHYLHAAKQFEHEQNWDAAMQAYAKAKAVSITPIETEKKRQQMEWKMRQLRLNKLLTQRRAEDAILLHHTTSILAQGINSNDMVYQRWRNDHQQQIDDRADLAYREAKRYLRKGWPEIAYIQIESYFRLQPETTQGDTLWTDIQRQLPKQLSIPPIAAHKTTGTPSKSSAKRPPASKPVRPQHKQTTAKKVHTAIQSAIQSGNLVHAEQLVHIYHRNHGKNATVLLQQVQNQRKIKAADLFAQGGNAFGREKLDQAIAYWHKAVILQPEKLEYRAALRRAEQLQERLVLLRDKTRHTSSQGSNKAIAKEK